MSRAVRGPDFSCDFSPLGNDFQSGFDRFSGGVVMTAKHGKSVYIDAIKAAAILWVTGFHVSRFVGNPTAQIAGGFDFFRCLRNVQVAVLLFFIVASFLTAKSLMSRTTICRKTRAEAITMNVRNILHFYWSRFIRLAPAYYISLFFWSFQPMFLCRDALKTCNLKDVLSHVLFFHTLDMETAFSISGVLWYLGVLAQFYLIAPCLFFLVKAIFPINRKKIQIPLTCLIVLLSCIPTILISTLCPPSRLDLQWNILSFLPTIVFGTFCSLGFFRTYGPAKYITCCTALLLAFWLLFFPIPHDIPLVKHVITSMLLFYVCFNFRGMFRRIPEAIQKNIHILSAASLSIYLYNYIFYICAPSKVYPMAKFIIWVLLTVGFGIVMYTLIEKPLSKIPQFLKPTASKRRRIFAFCLLPVLFVLPFIPCGKRIYEFRKMIGLPESACFSPNPEERNGSSQLFRSGKDFYLVFPEAEKIDFKHKFIFHVFSRRALPPPRGPFFNLDFFGVPEVVYDWDLSKYYIVRRRTDIQFEEIEKIILGQYDLLTKKPPWRFRFYWRKEIVDLDKSKLNCEGALKASKKE